MAIISYRATNIIHSLGFTLSQFAEYNFRTKDKDSTSYIEKLREEVSKLRLPKKAKGLQRLLKYFK